MKTPLEPGIARLAPDLVQIRLPLPFRLRLINLYLFRGADGWSMIDAGIDTPECRDSFAAALDELGIEPRDIARVFVTHMHPDHIGMSGRRAADGALAYIMEDEERRARYVWSDDPLDDWAAYLRRLGAAADLAHGVVEAAQGLRRFVTLPERFAHVRDGDSVRLGDRACRVVWTPGHSDHHYVLVDDEHRTLFCADQLLPEITPNIGLYPECRPDPLADFFDSFETLGALDGYTVFPAHGPVYEGVGPRIAQLRAHHEQRLAGVRALAAAAGAEGITAMDVVERFWGQRLTPHEVRFALVEVAAHAAFLERRGELRALDRDGVLRYSKC